MFWDYARIAVVCLAAGDLYGQAAGFVLSLDGSWTVTRNGSKLPLAEGQQVLPGDFLRSNPPDSLIKLVLYDGSYRSCDKSGAAGKVTPECQQPIAIPQRPAQSTGFMTILARRLSNQQRPPINFVTSRGFGPPPPIKLKDGVLPATGANVDFSKALSAPPPSDLRLILKPIELPTQCKPLELKLSPGIHSMVIPGLVPACLGLYELASTDKAMESASPATVLLLSPNQLAGASKLFSDAAALSGRWRDLDEDEQHSFSRIALSAIQQSLQSQK